jgi:periplasmic copper chaperone A
MKRPETILGLLLSCAMVSTSLAGELSVTGAWSRSTPPGIPVGVVYLNIRNDTGKSDRLLKLKTTVASSIEVHRTETIEGLARMREVSVLHIAPGETVKFEPGGMHLMLMGLKSALVEGKTFDLELQFEVAGPRKVKVAVKKP